MDYTKTLGAGVGYVDSFDMNGVLQQRVIAKGPLNAPWGLAIGPPNFGAYAGKLLVGFLQTAQEIENQGSKIKD